MSEGENVDPVKPHAPGTPAVKPSGASRLMHVIGAVLVGAVLPAVVVGALVGQLGVSALFTGVLWGALGAKLGGTRRLVYLTPGIGLVAGLGAYTAYDWSWVALLAIAGLVSGVGFRFGWFGALLMAPYAATFVTPVSTGSAAVTFGVIVAIGTGYGIVIARRFGAPPVVEGDRYSLPVTVLIALAFGAVLGAAAALGVALSWTEPYWVPEPILILVMYLLMGRRERIREKAFGTALGAAAAVLVAIIAPPAWVLTALAIVAFLLAVTQRATYWRMYGLYTFSLVLYFAAPDDVAFEAEERGVQILAGIGILIIGLAILHAIGDRVARRYPQPELASASQPG
ncbi:FUSC family protein [Kribbella sp. NPDC049227]|uniref:FUSC family protein n=1 Tax=Kribbella sp. NPDC049227 TaxID=3364113 RepID=UPI0037202B70